MSLPAANPGAQPRPAIRVVIALFTVLLLAGLFLPDDTQALISLGNQISSGRRSQAYFESIMLAQDKVIERIKSQAKVTRKAYKQARKALTRSARAYRSVARTLATRRARLADLEAQHKDTPPEEIPAPYLERVRVLRRAVAKSQRQRVAAARELRTWKRIYKARRYRSGLLKRQRRAAVARREAAEGGLGAHIVNMTRLAQQRAELTVGARSASGSATAFSWPAVGRLAQTYGCTGFYLNPRRGSCRHFHDGLDIVAGYGSPVRTAQDGVIAFAGWNPWDEGGRAWIMVVSHPGGYVTRYGHLLPGGRARVGQVVRQGQAIGRMGNTGKSLGTHLHFELLRGSSPVNPWSYLPAGMVDPRVTRGPGRKGGKAGSRRHKAGHRKGVSRAERRERKLERRRERREARADGSDTAALEAAARPGILVDGGLGDSASALVESSLEDATTLLCDAIDRSGGADQDAAYGAMTPVMSAPRVHSAADQDGNAPRADHPCDPARATGGTGLAAASSSRPMADEPNGPVLEPFVGLLRRESQRS
jgi:murein DD-endopeptidase MepM/ murein hydrolase activator NlpD